jgi:hypothetical protein
MAPAGPSAASRAHSGAGTRGVILPCLQAQVYIHIMNMYTHAYIPIYSDVIFAHTRESIYTHANIRMYRNNYSRVYTDTMRRDLCPFLVVVVLGLPLFQEQAG